MQITDLVLFLQGDHHRLGALFCLRELIVGLKIHPEPRGAHTRPFQPDGQIRANSIVAMQDSG